MLMLDAGGDDDAKTGAGGGGDDDDAGGGGDLPLPIGARHQLPLLHNTHVRHLRCQLL